MLTWQSFFLISAILSGQLIKLLIFPDFGPTLLDFTIIFFCSLGITKLKFKLSKPPLFVKYGLIFIAIASLSLIFTPLNLQITEYAIGFSYIVRFSVILLLGWIIYSGGIPKLKQQIPQIMIISGVSLAILGLFQLIFIPDIGFLEKNGWDPHYFRVVSTFLDPNFVGSYFALTFLLLITKTKKWHTLFLVLLFVSLLFTFSRSSYLMFLVSGFALALLNKSFKIFTIYSLLFIVLISGYYLYTQNIAKPRGIDRMGSAAFRIDTWQQGLQIFQKSPILGVGFNAYKYAIREYNLADDNFLKSRGATSNDSSLLFILATTGIIGLISYLLFLGSFAWSSRKNFILLSALAGLLIQSFFANVLFYPFILLWIILIIF